MNSKKATLLFSLFLIINNLFSQGLRSEYDFDELNKNIKTAKLVDTRSILLKNRHTLEAFLPYVHRQAGDECAAYTINTCRTILYARDNKMTDINKISFESFSPHYTYISYKRDIEEDTIEAGLPPDFKGINSLGFYKIRKFEYPDYYPFTNKDIESFPSLDFLKAEALKYQFSGFERVPLDTSNKAKEIIIKQKLSKDNPAYVSFYPWPANIYKSESFWDISIKIRCKAKEDSCINQTNDISGLCIKHKPKDWEAEGGHAVVLIGYDDKINGGSFLIFNSHGDSFGDNGKMWINYEDFFQNTRNIIFTYTNEVKDYSLSSSNSGDNMKISSTKSYKSRLSFNWAIRMPVINNLGTYKGEKKNGKRHGDGVFLSDNLVEYNGNWENDVPYDNGEVKLNDKFLYNAIWRNQFELPVNYESIEYYDDGAIQYKGEFDNNQYHGKGTYFYKDGWRYEGSFVEGSYNGIGIKYRADGTILYKGEFDNNQYHGKGTYFYKDGWRYEGSFVEGSYNGIGIKYDVAGGKYYEGEWKDHKFHGNGIFYYSDGSVYQEGQFIKGEFVK